MNKHREKTITGFSVILLSLAMMFLANSQIQEVTLTGVTPRAIPLLVSRLICALGVIMAAQGIIMEVRSGKNVSDAQEEKRFSPFPFLLFGLMVLYAVMMYAVGYMIASFTILPLMMYVLKERKPLNYAILAGLIIFIFFIIDIVLKIRLPKIGILGII